MKEEKGPFKCHDTVIEAGAEFESFESLDLAIKAYEAENLVNMIVRDTRTIEAAEKRNSRKNYNPAIKYSDVCYCCTYGGKRFRSQSTGKRTHKSTKQACPFNLKLRATPDGQRLFIREMCTSHNHEINEAEFRLHPKQRKLDQRSQEEIAALLSLEPDKKFLREKLMQVTGKVILMKDIHNIKTRLVNSKDKDQIAQDLSLPAQDTEKDVHHSQIAMVELVDNLIHGTDQGSHGDLQDEKQQQNQQQQLVTNSLSIHIPVVTVSQINPTDLNSVLHTIVNSTHQENISGSQPRSQSQTVPVNHTDIATGSEFSHSSNVFTCPLIDSFSHQTQEIYHVSALTDVVPIVAKSPSLVNLHQHPNEETSRHQSFNPLEDVNSMGMSILHTLPSWQDLESHSHHTTNFHAANILPLSQESVVHCHVTPPHSISPPDTCNETPKVLSEPTSLPLSLSPRTITLDNPNRAHFQHQQKQQNVQSRKKPPKSHPSPHVRGKSRRNPIEVDKEVIKRKYFQRASVNLFFNERFSFHGNKLTKDRLFTSGVEKMSSEGADNYHEMLKPLSWLFGTWKGEQGKGIYPNIQDFAYSETAEFYPVPLKPMVEYKFYSYKPDGSMPMHRETGFIRIKPNSNHIAFVASHNLGIAEVQEGEVKGEILMVETTELARVSFNKPPVVKKVRRTLKRTGDSLEHIMDMQTDATEMTEHLRITFKKVDS